MENNDTNNTDYLNWLLMSDPSVDLTALPPPNDLPASADSIGNVDLLNYILGNEGIPSSSAPSFSSLPANAGQQNVAITIPRTPVVDICADSMYASTAVPAPQTAMDFPVTTTTTRGGSSSSSSSDDHTYSTDNKHHTDDDEDEISESQLKMMTSRERRQLRNKISARKFRNRRKEYISMLETEVRQQKAENSRLRLEVTWIRGTVDKLQKENDQLRLELVLCKEGIKPRRPYVDGPPCDSNDKAITIDHSLPDASVGRSSSLSPPSLGSGSTAFGMSDHSSISSHSPNSNNPSPPVINNDFVDPWNLVLPEHHQYQPPHHQNTYLSYAVMPEWNLPNILHKEAETTALVPANQLIQRYPLLVPALMSIILGHTMTMTTQELVSHAKLLTPPPSLMSLDDDGNDQIRPRYSANDLWFGPKFTKGSKATKIPTGQELHSIWEALQRQREMSLDTWYKEETENHDQPNTMRRQRRQPPSSAVDLCPLNWLQKQFCRFVHEQIITRYPQLEQPCKTYLPVCEKYTRRPTTVVGSSF